MSEGVARAINDCVSRVGRRLKLLTLQDQFVAAIIVAGPITALATLLARAGTSTTAGVLWFAAAVVIILLALIVASLRRRPAGSDVALLIDNSLGLEDRLATAHQIISRDRVPSGIEQALVADAAERIAPAQATTIVPYRMKRWYGLALVSLAVLAATIAVQPQQDAAVSDEEMARADIREAGRQLEDGADEIEKLAPVSTETARLAREQAEIGKSFRMSPASRAEALKRLSALEERIAGRQRALEQTKANEIVSLADSRFQAALAGAGARKIDANTDPHATNAETRVAREANATDAGKPKSDPADAYTERKEGSGTASNQQAGRVNETKDKDQDHPQASPEKDRPAKEAKGGGEKSSTETTTARETGSRASGQPADQSKGEEKTAGQAETGEVRPDSTASPESSVPQTKESEPQPGQSSPPDTGSLPRPFGSSPSLSEQLLKRALEMKEGQLSERDIRQLIDAAKGLSKDLEKIAQSKELRESLEELAKKVNPEQLEQVARELAKNEDLKRELIAATRLMQENQKAKEVAAGLTELARSAKEEIPGQSGGQRAGQTSAEPRNGARGAGRENAMIPPPLTGTDVRSELSGKGKGTIARGKVSRGDGGEYLYVQSRLPNGVARTPYSSAYPQYRREAEQFVQRTTVPPAMRSMVRDYFDAINPNQK